MYRTHWIYHHTICNNTIMHCAHAYVHAAYAYVHGIVTGSTWDGHIFWCDLWWVMCIHWWWRTTRAYRIGEFGRTWKFIIFLNCGVQTPDLRLFESLIPNIYLRSDNDVISSCKPSPDITVSPILPLPRFKLPYSGVLQWVYGAEKRTK